MLEKLNKLNSKLMETLDGEKVIDFRSNSKENLIEATFKVEFEDLTKSYILVIDAETEEFEKVLEEKIESLKEDVDKIKNKRYDEITKEIETIKEEQKEARITHSERMAKLDDNIDELKKEYKELIKGSTFKNSKKEKVETFTTGTKETFENIKDLGLEGLEEAKEVVKEVGKTIKELFKDGLNIPTTKKNNSINDLFDKVAKELEKSLNNKKNSQ